MRYAITTQSCASMQHFAHKLKGMARNVAAARVAALCEMTEKSAANGELVASEVVDQLDRGFSESCEAIAAMLAQGPRTSTEELSAVDDQGSALTPSESQVLLQIMNDQAIFRTTRDGIVTTWNKSARAIMGYDSKEIIGKHFSVLYRPEDAAIGKPAQHLETAVRAGKFEEDGIRVRKGGEPYWAHVVIVPQYDSNGQVTEFINFRREISATKAIRAELEKTQRAFYGLFENAMDAICLVDSNEANPRFNRSFLELTGFGEDELISNDAYLLLTPEEFHALDRVHRRLIENQGRPSCYEKELINRDGHRVPVLTTLIPLLDSDGHRLGIATIFRDLRSEKRAILESERARDAAIEFGQSKAAFLASMSHEIRTPLNGIIGMASLLAQTAKDQEIRELVDGIRTSGEHLVTIVNEVLDFSRIESGKIEMETVAFSPRTLVEEALVLFSEPSRDQGITFSADVPGGVPHSVQGDPTKVRQILFNFLSNAMKFTKGGRVSLRLRAERNWADTCQLVFEVEDTGIGMSEAVLRTIFAPFVQADCSTTRRYGGTGLGLAIAKRLADMMGGQVGVKSTPGKGSLFWLALTAPVVEPKRLNPRADLQGIKACWQGGSAPVRQIVAAHLANRGLPLWDGPATSSDLALTEEQGALTLRLGPESAVLRLPYKQSELYRRIATLVTGDKVAADGANAPSVQSGKMFDHSSSRVLVVDDSEMNRNVAMRMLEKVGLNSDSACNGFEALEAVQKTPYDLILMDCLMPEMDGFTATREIRKRGLGPDQIAIVAMTANSRKSDGQTCQEAGMNDFLEKPMRLEDLVAVLKRHIS